MKRKDVNDRLMHSTWLATTAFCTKLHDIGFDTEEIAEVMPDGMKFLGDVIARRCFPVAPGPMLRMLSIDAIKVGQEYAERLASFRAGVKS